MRRIRRPLTYANVMATIAVFIALGGSALAKVIITNNSQVAENTIAGHHAKGSKHPNIVPDSISARDLQQLVFHKPTLRNGWTPAERDPAFTEDAYGIVHLLGSVVQSGGSSNSTIFKLPPAYRPPGFVDTPVAIVGGEPGVLTINVDGTVAPVSGPTTFVDLEGVAFRPGN